VSRDFRLFLEGIVEACRKIGLYIEGHSKESLVANEMAYDAVIRNLEVLGEATKHLPEDVRKGIPGIEWKQIIGMRDFIAHWYWGLDADLRWDTVVFKVPDLRSKVEAFLAL
jgi:uncharacterized protein with HEPN domain